MSWGKLCFFFNKHLLLSLLLYILIFLFFINIFSWLNAPGVHIKISSFDPAFFRGELLIGVRRWLIKCNFLSFFQADLSLPVFGDSGVVCQGGRGDFSLRLAPRSSRMITVRTLPKVAVLWYRTFCCAASILKLCRYFLKFLKYQLKTL